MVLTPGSGADLDKESRDSADKRCGLVLWHCSLAIRSFRTGGDIYAQLILCPNMQPIAGLLRAAADTRAEVAALRSANLGFRERTLQFCCVGLAH